MSLEEGEINISAQLMALIEQVRETNTNLAVMRQENAAIREENATLRAKVDSLAIGQSTPHPLVSVDPTPLTPVGQPTNTPPEQPTVERTPGESNYFRSRPHIRPGEIPLLNWEE